MTDLFSLAERVAASLIPDKELDRQIMLAIGFAYQERDIGCRYDDGSVALDWVYVDPKTDKWVSTHPRPFTSSIDAAITLVPGDWFWKVGYSTLHDGWANVYRTHPDHADRDDAHFSEASSPALALVAACLKARSIGAAA